MLEKYIRAGCFNISNKKKERVYISDLCEGGQSPMDSPAR